MNIDVDDRRLDPGTPCVGMPREDVEVLLRLPPEAGAGIPMRAALAHVSNGSEIPKAS